MGAFKVQDLPKRIASVEASVTKALPLLPQATVVLPQFRYKDAKKTIKAGKGPSTEELSFIMPMPWMERDLRNKHFLEMMRCKLKFKSYDLDCVDMIIMTCVSQTPT